MRHAPRHYNQRPDQIYLYNIERLQSDLQALEQLIHSINDNIGGWLAYEREQQRHCNKCNVNHRLYERHDTERCPYCNRKIK